MAIDTPRVSVITTIRNGERFLAEAIASILGQSYGDFEYLLVDDASTDTSPEIIAHFAGQDPRIVALHNANCINHSNAINVALPVARGEFVAILDADDLAHPQRLESQVIFLDANPEVGVVGAQVQKIDSDGRPQNTMSFPTTAALSRWSILFGTPVLHSAAMMRRALLQAIGGYSVQWRYANDYSLWAELIGRTTITNLTETLVSYRHHEEQISSTRATPQRGEVWLLIHRMLAERLALRIPLNDIGVLYHGTRGVSLGDGKALEQATTLLATIRTRYLVVEQPDASTAEQINADCAWRLLTMAWVHRHSHRTESRIVFHDALVLDPQLFRRRKTCARLRHLFRNDRRQAEAPS